MPSKYLNRCGGNPTFNKVANDKVDIDDIIPNFEDEVKEEIKDEIEGIKKEIKEEIRDEIETDNFDLDTKVQQMITNNERFVALTCRSIRTGSYKVLTKEKVYFTQNGIILKLPYLTDPNKLITIVIQHREILKFEVLSGRSIPLIFISTTTEACERIRKDLNLTFKDLGLHYDINSLDETMKRIVMLPEKLLDDTKELLKIFYPEVLCELNPKVANEMLAKSTPKSSIMQVLQTLQKSVA